ncbi:hypothetical protein AAF712_004601 [Marasmius tenuissimus]|uniref:Uncharacterized protein n=1 Tax=Marasmius tenuissimus TaxID=585030 RepID=A0ABR3A2V8_9AGAR
MPVDHSQSLLIQPDRKFQPRWPSRSDLQLLRHHFAANYHELFIVKARELCKECVAKSEALPVIWVNHTKFPPTLEALSNDDYTEKLNATDGPLVIVDRASDVNNVSDGVLVCGLIPWQGTGTEGSLLALYRDHIPEDVETKEELATSS